MRLEIRQLIFNIVEHFFHKWFQYYQTFWLKYQTEWSDIIFFLAKSGKINLVSELNPIKKYELKLFMGHPNHQPCEKI